MTALRDAPNDTIAAEVIWLGRIVWPMMLTPATPYRARSFARRGLSDWAGRPLRTFERTPCAVSTTTSIERTLPTIAAGMATAGWMPPTTPMMAPPYDSTKGTAPAIITPSHWRNAVPLWIAACIIAPVLERRLRWGLVLLAAVVTAAHGVIAHSLGHPILLDERGAGTLLVAYAAALPFMVISGVWWWEIVVTLDRHRAAAADLAVAEERLRFAADLHDIQGHHLQVIALKAELDVLRHSRSTLSVQQIAARMHLAQGTVRNYLSSAMTKLDARSRHEAAEIAWNHGWI